MLLPVVLILMGCDGDAKKAGDDLSQRKINVVTTTGMITDAVKNIGGERVSVNGLMGPGVDPHLYKASAGDVGRMQSADIIFYNGLHLEGAMAELFEKMARTTRTVAVADGIPAERLVSPPQFEGMHDPHVWFDVTLWMDVVRHIEKILAESDTVHAGVYHVNAAAYLARLAELDASIREQVQTVPQNSRVIITAHDAFNYMGRAYGFEVRGLQGISTATEAGTRDVQELAMFIVERKIPAIFVESSVPRRTVEALQAAVEARGFAVAIGGELFSDAMGDPGTPEGTYIGMVEHNIHTIVHALIGEKK
ncbi:MAG: zinc ABC transporter substrate-binding protein [candidate division Zixibacteria bacterium]|nr:zinc ABC transporter substrate-binding protein [candidate division Zixibacteria bacterium]